MLFNIAIALYCALNFSNGQETLPTGIPILLSQCGKYPYSQFNATKVDNHTIFSVVGYQGSCIDCNYCQVGKTPYTWNCSLGQKNQWWNVVPATGNSNNMLFQSTVNGSTCIEIIDNFYTRMAFCNASNINQQFIVNGESIAAAYNSSLCMGVGYYNCTISPFNTYPYCNQELPVDDRVDDLISRMTLYEKTSNLPNSNIGVPRLGVPANRYGEALHGVLGGCASTTYNNNTGCPTSFPHALLMSATFNRTLWKHVGIAISTEVRAFDNLKQGSVALFRWTPDINLFRDPRWGRGQEVPGEDPFLTGQYVAQYSYNMQNGLDTKYLKLVSTAKHYMDYDQEGNYGTERGDFDANVTEQDQVEYYWPGWRSAVQVARVQSIMCSYNAVNNIPSCGNDYSMNQIARQEWGFDGFFVSDCGAIGDGASTRYIQQTYPQNNITTQHYLQAKQAIHSGCDANCGNFWKNYLLQSVEAGVTSIEDVDRSARRIFKEAIKLGKLDYSPPSYYTNINAYGAAQIDSPQHRALALSAAEQGIVLLKNDGDILPLVTSGKKIALIGPHANVTQDMLSNYHGTNILVNSNSPYQIFKAAGGNSITYSQGCDVYCAKTSGFADAVSAAKAADYAIVFLGLHPDGCGGNPNEGSACESEGHDRNTIELAGNQSLLLQQVYAVNQNTILVLIHGGALNISWAKSNVPGIIDAFYPGELGGVAIKNIIYGMSAPAGKLPTTIYDSSLLSERPSIMDMSLRGGKGITYRYYTGTPVYWFGMGLYYTTFTYKYYNSTQLDINGERVIKTKSLADAYRNGEYQYKSDATYFIVEITNTGKVSSDCIVLGFVQSENNPDAPLNKLFDFQRAYVPIGMKVNVTLSITPESISVTNKYGNERIVPGKYNIFLGDYMNNNYVHHRVNMVGDEESIFDYGKIKQKWNARKYS